MLNYGFTKIIDQPFESVIEKVTEELKKEGFGILTTIDVKEKFKEKLGLDFKKYIILGACNPSSAHKAIQTEENIGLLLPCNVVVYEKDGKTAIAIIKPAAAMQMIENVNLHEIAEDIEQKLKNVFEAL
ncbi:hypothetical protein ES705_17100 [subsurface metagenome]|nr:DUF302 domain-containing protein [Spirochaetota bacterium]